MGGAGFVLRERRAYAARKRRDGAIAEVPLLLLLLQLLRLCPQLMMLLLVDLL